jgi:hypothetical protein
MSTDIATEFFFRFLGVGWDWVHLARRPLTGLLYQPRIIADECGAVGGMIIDRGNRSTQRKSALVPLCPPQIPLDLGSNPGRRGGKPATNRLSYGTANHGVPVSIYKFSQRRGQIKILKFRPVKQIKLFNIFSAWSSSFCMISGLKTLEKTLQLCNYVMQFNSFFFQDKKKDTSISLRRITRVTNL